MSIPSPRLDPRLALASIAILVGCASNEPDTEIPRANATQSGAPQSGAPVSGPASSEATWNRDATGLRTYTNGSRYITSLGLPASIRVTPPDWIVNPAIDGVMGAVGVSATNDLGTRHQLEEARTSARLEMAQMFETRVQEVGRFDVEQYLRVDRSESGLSPQNSSKSSNLGVERNITDLVLSGSRQRALWFDPINGDCYVWLVMDGGIPGMADHSLENGVSIYVANQAIGTEYRPNWPVEPKPEPAAPAPIAPPIQKSPTEKLEEALRPIESIPVKDGND